MRLLTAPPASGRTAAMPKAPKPKPRKVTAQDIADIRGALDFAQDIARAHGDDCRLAFRKADRALDRIVTRLFAKAR
jgi:hypothetical protein